jgi:hypothetical protein
MLNLIPVNFAVKQELPSLLNEKAIKQAWHRSKSYT